MNDYQRIDRRTALKWIATASVLFPALDWNATAQKAQGTPADPFLNSATPWWDRTLTKEELNTLAALCDTIIPADDKSPSASQVNVPDFIDEWISAPYPTQQTDKPLIRDGLKWINDEATKRFQKRFEALDEKQKNALCDDICFLPKAKPEFEQAAKFFARTRDLTASGFYTSAEGTRDLKYIGNVALTAFPGPPPAVLKHLGLEA